ncbi:hypothetical protein CR969_02645 [Candidatus Saccharibacteria bacterium]|nr:MAG: hypothetical protein CR969_02645 [Candidatus Saccharibacteria bacterium]
MVIGLAFMIHSSSVVYADKSVCIAARDSSTGLQGDPQTHNVLTNDIPALGAHFLLNSLIIRPADGAIGAITSPDEKIVTIPGEGVYTAGNNGVIKFVPDRAFFGRAKGVIYSITDSAGVTLSSSYTPIVNRTVAEPIDLGVRAVSFELLANGIDASTSLIPGPVRQWRGVTLSGDGSMLSVVAQGNYIYTANQPYDELMRISGAGQREWKTIDSTPDGQRLVAVAESSYVYTSVDGGSNWSAKPGSGVRLWSSVAISDDGSSIIAAADYEQLQVSTDSGDSWMPVTAVGAELWSAVTISSDGNRMTAIELGGRVFASNDGGSSWVEQTSLPAGNWHTMASSSDGQRLVVAGFGTLSTSADGGATWADRNVGGGTYDWQAVASSADGNVLYAQDYGGYIFRSSDGGISWSEQTSSGQHSWSSIATSSDGSHVAATNELGYVHTSSDGGSTWIEHKNEQLIDPSNVDIDPDTPGQQLTIDKTSTEGWSASYDPATDNYVMTSLTIIYSILRLLVLNILS